MKRIHIIGGKNHGKTTLVTELVEELTAQGFRIGTIKHTHHAHELDTPGKDSHRHREAGAAVVGILTRSMNALFWPPAPEPSDSDARYEAFAPMMADCHCTLVEGDTKTGAIKIEVWRETLGTEPLAASDDSIVALVTDDQPLNVAAQVWPRGGIAQLAERIVTLAGMGPGSPPH